MKTWAKDECVFVNMDSFMDVVMSTCNLFIMIHCLVGACLFFTCTGPLLVLPDRALASLLELGSARVEFPNKQFKFPNIWQYKTNCACVNLVVLQLYWIF